ncbi:MAG TPA: maleylpyruvate isomerase family mycothiol-dependent enzyme [Acidimicrobiales bacterium]|nr:maleylpyruvate isomerase family mycothiol-dependent enzyme [Acidimicrobiales bacterium]
MVNRLHVLADSVRHLKEVASRIDPAKYTSPAYPSDWTIADTFSHLGSGAVIGERRFEDSIANRESDPAFNASVWDEWNAKDPKTQVKDCLVSDAAIQSSLEMATDEQRRTFHFMMGPFSFDFDGLVGLRLGEHVLHTWDIEVAIDPLATLPNGAANAILDGVQFIVARAAKPTGVAREVTLRTVDPVRDFTLVLDIDTVDLVEARHEGSVDLEIPAEALVRLIYGRLDKKHSPASASGNVADFLRPIFPGI